MTRATTVLVTATAFLACSGASRCPEGDLDLEITTAGAEADEAAPDEVAPEPEAEPQRPPTPETYAALFADAPVRFAARARVKRFGEARLRHDGPVVTGPAEEEEPDDEEDPGPPPRARVVVQVEGERVRIAPFAGLERGLHFLLWIDRADLLGVVAENVALRRTPGARPPRAGQPGVTLLPGLVVDVAERRGDFVKVAYRDDSAELEGWIPATAMGPVFDHESLDPPAEWLADDALARETWVVVGDGTVFERPGARPLAKLHGFATFFRGRTVDPNPPPPNVGVSGPRGYSEIRLRRAAADDDGGYEIVGWILNEDLVPPGGRGRGRAGGGRSRRCSVMGGTIPDGTWLYDAPGGDVVGVARGDQRRCLQRGEGEGGAWFVEAWSEWGLTRLWAPRLVDLTERGARADPGF